MLTSDDVQQGLLKLVRSFYEYADDCLKRNGCPG
jgi:hypothetical protein